MDAWDEWNGSGLLLASHHAKASTEGAFLPHTWNFDWLDFTINGQSVGEIGIEPVSPGTGMYR